MLNKRQSKRLERAVSEELTFRVDIAIMHDEWKRGGLLDPSVPDPDDWPKIEIEQAPNGTDKPAVYITLTDRVLRLFGYEGNPQLFMEDYLGKKIANNFDNRPKLRFVAGYLFAETPEAEVKFKK